VACIAHIVSDSAGYIRFIRVLAIQALAGFVHIVIKEFPTANQTPSLMILRISLFHDR
jgi:hypothetical protein